MLTLVLGRAGTGKTKFAMDDMLRKMQAGQSQLLFVVPEQYSHDAERQLTAVCGDGLSLHGEALSFSRLCGRVFSETGGTARRELDGGGLILVMHRAVEAVSPRLKAFASKGLRIEFLESLLDVVKEFKSLNITPDALSYMSPRTSGPLSDKLHDLALIFGAYDGYFSDRADPSDRLTRLAESIGESSVGDAGHIYFDGFNDFTAQELRVIEELLRKNAELTVCLTLDENHSGDEIFELPRKTDARLRRLADKYGVKVNTISPDAPGNAQKAEELEFLEKHLFIDGEQKFGGECRAVRIYSASTQYAECEYAAHRIWELVRSGYRWRDIGVMARDWAEYGPICENVFEKYGVQFFSGGRADIMQKPPCMLIDAALEIAAGGFEYRPVFRFLKTGLAGIPPDSLFELENYVLKWNIRGPMWTREDDWTLPPSGYGETENDAALGRINALRRRIAEPLIRLRDGIRGVTDAETKIRALYGFLDEIRFPESLEEKATAFEKRGEMRLADEYAQLWDIIKNAMEQMLGIFGESPLSAAEFRKLFALVLSQYDVGVIPVSLDRTALGGMAMSRRRDLKCLIILGATDDNMPKMSQGGGTLSGSEREELIRLGADMPAGPEDRLRREMNMIYSTLTLPSRELVVTYPGGGRPSFIVGRMRAMFGIRDITLREDEYMTAAEIPCFELASFADSLNGGAVSAAREYFMSVSSGASANLSASDTAMRAGRAKLSGQSARLLYGHEPLLSASRVDKYYSCPFAHFLQNGLQLSQRVPAGFDAPDFGIFLHYVLEGVSREIRETVGFKHADDELCKTLTARYIDKYVCEKLLGFEGKNDRFIYLFRRLEDDTRRIVLDMLDELRRSDFEPLDFELEFSQFSDTAKIRGVVDRVDGFLHGGKLYLRVIDYKTGKKAFSLSDVLYGRNMQMLIYLFALLEHGIAPYGKEVVPAGVLCVPARDIILKAARNATEDEIEKQRAKELRRGGLILDDPFVLEAMENGDEKKYLPVKAAKDGFISDSLASSEQIAKLSEHIRAKLSQAEAEILAGGIERSPYYRNAADNACLYCAYRTACFFDEDAGDRRRYVRKLKAGEVWDTLEGEVGRGE